MSAITVLVDDGCGKEFVSLASPLSVESNGSLGDGGMDRGVESVEDGVELVSGNIVLGAEADQSAREVEVRDVGFKAGICVLYSRLAIVGGGVISRAFFSSFSCGITDAERVSDESKRAKWGSIPAVDSSAFVVSLLTTRGSV